ncbi:MAG: autotransporter outer membrane beta-barrel domain-containing protein [Prevotella sp.]|nr:autotransporter outer membrane beta-barrel domain-containing protein [Prevotella sp.]MBR1461886.1 autotransporter outer membrane beta-barrel domain-containing protein [Prevotella sp.]
MEKTFKTIALSMLLLWGTGIASAQDIEIKDFERNYTSLIASMNPVNDNAGEACAIIRFSVRDTSFVIEPNLGVVKRINKPGEILLYVPKGTKRITVRHKKMMPLRDYDIPETIESKTTYDAVLTLSETAIARQKANKNHNVFIGAGFNILSISGPSASIGFDINHHVTEISVVYGMNKTGDLYFYDKANTLKAVWNYNALRTSLRYGYDFQPTDFLGIMPQLGVAVNMFTGSDGEESRIRTENYKKASSVSALAALRFTISFSNNFKIQLTPEYDFGVMESNNCELVCEYDSTFKSWTNGFNINLGLIIFF